MTTINNKKVSNISIVIEGINYKDYPDFCDAFATEAIFEDGSELSDFELDILNDDTDLIYELAYERCF